MAVSDDDNPKMERRRERSFKEIHSITEFSNSNPSPTVHTSKRRVIRNTAVLGFSYFLFFTGFWSLSNLQSTMNVYQGIGVDSQAVIYLCSMVSCFLPELLMDKFGTKTTYAISLLLGCPYIAANFSLRWDTMMASAVLYGLVSGPRNAAITVYLDEMSDRFRTVTGDSRENANSFIFGLFVFFTEFNQVVGNALSYVILQKGHPEPPRNFSAETVCGVHFDPDAANGTNANLEPPSEHERYLVSGIFLAFGLLAAADALILDPLGNDIKEVKGCHSVSQRIVSSVKHLKNPQQLFLLPLTIYIGIEGAFYSADYTQAYIACAWGVHHVGFVSICYGACGALMGICVGRVVKCVSLMSVIITIALLNVVTCALLFVWQPSPDQPVIFFIFAGIFGATDAIMWSQVAGLYGVMFPNDREAAYSNFFFWGFFGHFLSYAYANYLTVSVKIVIMLVFLIVGTTLYVIGQIKMKDSKHNYTLIAICDSEQE